MSKSELIHSHHSPHGITKADIAAQDREKLIKRDFTVAAPLKSCLPISPRFSVLTEISIFHRSLTASNGKIGALEMHDNMKKGLCIDTLK